METGAHRVEGPNSEPVRADGVCTVGTLATMLLRTVESKRNPAMNRRRRRPPRKRWCIRAYRKFKSTRTLISIVSAVLKTTAPMCPARSCERADRGSFSVFVRVAG